MKTRERIYNVTSLPKPEKEPNYKLRRAVAAGLAGVALLGIGKSTEAVIHAAGSAIDTMTESDFDSHDCTTDGGETVIIGSGETVWNAAASPLAQELNTSVDTAMLILHDANPTIDSLGSVDAGTSVTIPVCKP